MIAVQIGSNKGFDDFTEIIKDKNIEKLILVEPFEEHNESLLECYKHISDLHIENIIVNDDSNLESEVIYYHEEDATHSNKFELASLNMFHSLKIRSFYDKEGIKDRRLPSMTLNQLMNKYNITHIDILFVDTEGFDDKIIKSIDFDQLKIKEIYYENLHIDSENLRTFLKEKNYEVTKEVGYGGWSDHAKVINFN